MGASASGTMTGGPSSWASTLVTPVQAGAGRSASVASISPAASTSQPSLQRRILSAIYWLAPLAIAITALGSAVWTALTAH